ncbi:hypothetical protein KGQ27_00675 [Patescibacteria group bacterium]|nr:hypothetical protein [Patescibacteria group bacterium]MDE1946861.1 hypothetical protein [Patescibacteria group bacterium]MDE2010681.1 hypothetical protein [Patescibacteria group bacterium]MDE2232713.1 hypothetical protein [Patescibacteria group bacterium]
MKKSINDNPQLLLNLFKAYYDARRHKGLSANVLAFSADYESKLFKLYEDILDRRYVIGPSVCFIVNRPVKREIFAADFRDRVVHHLIFNYLNPIVERDFIKDSYSCRLGKGTSYGVRRVNHFLHSCSENYTHECWIMKLDIRGYFMSMNKDILYGKVKEVVDKARNISFDKELLMYLVNKVVYHDPVTNCRIKGDRSDWVGLPKSKSLFFAEKNRGFPIGNLTSQLFGNIYMNRFDHIIKEDHNFKHYGRYVDDMIFVHKDKGTLASTIPIVKKYLFEELGLELHTKKIYLQPSAVGVSFLGAYIKRWCQYVGKKTKTNCYTRISRWNSEVNKNSYDKFLSSMNSYLGFMSQYDTYRLRQKVMSKLSRQIVSKLIISKDFSSIKINSAANTLRT